MGVFNSIKNALTKTATAISGVTELFTKKGIDNNTIEEFEEILLLADFGVKTTNKILEQFKKVRISKNDPPETFRNELIKIISEILTKNHEVFQLKTGLNIIVFCGVNGNGKTTTIGKLANLFVNQGSKVLVAACDTFRSAAVSQLEIWAQKSNTEVVKGHEKSDPASVAHNAVIRALEESYDVLLIDTAGRLQNKNNLMSELTKIINVINKLYKEELRVMLTLDSTTGQNAAVQVEKFKEVAQVSGLIFTKLDGTAKGGSVVGICDAFNLPIFYLASGENIEDILPFDPDDFAEALVS